MVTPSTSWRLKTPGGVSYRVISMTGSVGQTEANIAIVAVINSQDLFAFVQDMMPFATKVGNFFYWQNRTLPGFPSVAVDNITFKAMVDGRPIDPFNYDTSSAPEGTYEDYIEVTVNYSAEKNPKKRKPDIRDPSTYLEISASTSIEVLNVYTGKSKWVQESNPKPGDAEDGEEGGGTENTWINPDTGELYGVFTDPDTGLQVRGALNTPDNDDTKSETTNKEGGSVPVSIIVPMTNWHVRWPDVDYEFFKTILINRIRAAQGKVNQKTVGFLYDAHPETLLFNGWSYTEKNTWRELSGDAGFTRTINTGGKSIPKPGEPPIDVTFNFTQKHIVWDKAVKGWNHYWSNDEGGWTRLKFAPNKDPLLTQSPYAKWDLNLLFKVT